MPKVNCMHVDCIFNKDKVCDYNGEIDVGWLDDKVGCPHVGSRFRVNVEACDVMAKLAK